MGSPARAVNLLVEGFEGPATVGVGRRTLLLPVGFLEQLNLGEFEALLAHEFAHMRRRDFAKNVLYGILSLPIAYHPMLWLTRRGLAETRELVCDAVAAEAVGGRESYARSLLRLASVVWLLRGRTGPRVLHAIGILDANIKANPKTIHVKSEGLTVVMAAVIGKDGAIENLRAVSGPPELQQSALDAVRQWRYQAFLLNGDPVAVETSIKVIYSLAK